MPRPTDAEARDRILGAASLLFEQHGIRAVGMARIVAEAGCGKNLLYRHFPSKEDLVLAHLQRFAEQRDRSTAAVVAGLERVPSAALVALAREVADRVTDPGFGGCALRGYLREMREAERGPGRFALGEIQKARRQVDELVARLDTDDPEALAGRIWVVLEGLYASAPYPDRDEAATAAVGLVQELLAAA